MKKSKFYCAVVLLMALVMLFSSGCSTISSFFGKDKDEEESASGTEGGKAVTSELSKNDKDAVKKLVGDFYTKLYKEPVESYKDTKAIPDNIKDSIAKSTLTEGANNPEIGIHLPRYVELNGLTVISYELLTKDADGGIETTYLGKSGDSYLYYAKVHLKAKCLPDELFNQAFKQNAVTGIYEKQPTAGLDEQKADYVRLIAKYDVEVVKDGSSFKILRAKEAAGRPGFQNRLMLLNNDFVERLPYINIEKSADNKTYVNNDDAKKFEAEKSVIEAFFNNLKTVDSDRMGLMTVKWKLGKNDFTDFVTNVLHIDKDGKSKEIMDITDDYKTKFNYESFPIKSNMLRITALKNFNIAPHPAYSQKQKRYTVYFDADVEMMTGMVGQKSTFKYDYIVVLSGEGDSTKVSGIYLNNYSYAAQPTARPAQ